MPGVSRIASIDLSQRVPRSTNRLRQFTRNLDMRCIAKVSQQQPDLEQQGILKLSMPLFNELAVFWLLVRSGEQNMMCGRWRIDVHSVV